MVKRAKKKQGSRSQVSRALPNPAGSPRLLVRGVGTDATQREIDAWDGKIPEGWRLVVKGNGGSMSSSWSTDYHVGVTSDRRAWVLSRAYWGDIDERRDEPEVQAVAVLVDPDTNDEKVIVQRLVDASEDWFNIDEITEEGEFDVALPGFKDPNRDG